MKNLLWTVTLLVTFGVSFTAHALTCQMHIESSSAQNPGQSQIQAKEVKGQPFEDPHHPTTLVYVKEKFGGYFFNGYTYGKEVNLVVWEEFSKEGRASATLLKAGEGQVLQMTITKNKDNFEYIDVVHFSCDMR